MTSINIRVYSRSMAAMGQAGSQTGRQCWQACERAGKLADRQVDS